MLTLSDENLSHKWFLSEFGHLVRAQERRYCNQMCGDVFGFYALQMGHAKMPITLRTAARNHAVIGFGEGCHIIADWTALPFANDSMDFILLAHALEITQTPHAVLREAVRVLRPHGRLLIVGFNPWSLLGMRLTNMPWRQRWLSLRRLKDWLALLNMSVVEGRFAVFTPPHTRKNRRRVGWMEKAGRRWWPLGGGVYFVSAIKQTAGVHLIGRLRYKLPLLNGRQVPR